MTYDECMTKEYVPPTVDNLIRYGHYDTVYKVALMDPSYLSSYDYYELHHRTSVQHRHR